MLKKITLPENFFSFNFNLGSVLGDTEVKRMTRFSTFIFLLCLLYPPVYQLLTGIPSQTIIWRELYILVTLLAPMLVSFYLVTTAQIQRQRVLDIISWAEVEFLNLDNANLRAFASDAINEAEKASENYHPKKYVLPLFLLTLISLIGFFPVFTFAGEIIHIEQISDIIAATPSTLVYGFVGAYLFVLYITANKSKNSDITPDFVLRLCLQLLIAPVAAYLITIAIPETSAPTVAFLIGFLPFHSFTAILYDAATGYYKKPDNAVTDEEQLKARALEGLENIKGMSKADCHRLHAENIYTIHNLAVANPMRLYLLMPHGMSQIIEWISQAYLRTFIDVQSFERLSPLGIHGAVSLCNKRHQIKSNTSIGKHLRLSIAKALGKEGEEIVVISLLDQLCSDPRMMFLVKLWTEKSGQ